MTMNEAKDSTEQDLYLAVKNLRADNRFEEARKILHVIGTKFDRKNDVRFRLEYAQTIGAEGQSEEALRIYENLRKEHPDNSHAFRLQSEILVEQGQYEPALEVLKMAPLNDGMKIDTLFRTIRLAIYLTARNKPMVFLRPEPSPPCRNAILIMMIRDEDDIIGENLLHHYRHGFRKFCLMLNCCKDKTEEIVRHFAESHADAILMLCIDPIEGYYQSNKTQSLLEFAVSYFSGIKEPADWAFVLDADEFISLERGMTLFDLISTASDQRKEIISFHLCNSTSSSGEEFLLGEDVYQHFDIVVPCSVPVVTKNAFRFSIQPKIEMGNHAVEYQGLGFDKHFVASTIGACIVHLPYRSRKQIRTKIVNGGSALEATTLAQALGAHWRRLYKELNEVGDSVVDLQLERHNSRTKRESSQQAKFFF